VVCETAAHGFGSARSIVLGMRSKKKNYCFFAKHIPDDTRVNVNCVNCISQDFLGEHAVVRPILCIMLNTERHLFEFRVLRINSLCTAM
jgi:hypothetical protein